MGMRRLVGGPSFSFFLAFAAFSSGVDTDVSARDEDETPSVRGVDTVRLFVFYYCLFS